MSFLILLSHPLIPLPKTVHAGGMLCIVNDLVARIGIGDDGLALPTATGELELGGQMQTEVDGGDAVAGERHLHALCLPVGQRILIASDVDGVREVLAA